jgi:hypothetical protein
MQATSRSSETGGTIGTKGRPAPSIPTGDDDTPNRNGSGSGGNRGQMGGTTPGIEMSGGNVSSGWKMRDLLASWRSWLIRYASVNR